MKKINIVGFFLTLLFASFSSFVYAQAKGFPPVDNQSAKLMGANDSDNNIIPIKATSEGALIVSGSFSASDNDVPPSTYVKFATETADTVKAGAGVVDSLSARNRNASDRFLLLVNKATDPVNNDLPVAVFVVAAGKQTIVGTDFFTNAGFNFSTGIAYCFSTTDDKCTLAMAADFDIMVQYE